MEIQRPRHKKLDIPIIPLIDILAILLIFFIVSTQFKKPRPILEINLPTVKQVPSSEIKDSRSTLAISDTGVMSVDGVRVTEGELESYLKAFLNVNPGRKLELEADKAVSLEKLFGIWDALTAVGIEIKDVPARIAIAP